MYCLTAYLYSSLYEFIFFFFNDTATTEIYTLSLHDALPICPLAVERADDPGRAARGDTGPELLDSGGGGRTSEHVRVQTWGSGEHTSEIQARPYLVCRLLL